MRLTNSTRNEILHQETRNKFHDKKLESDNEVKAEIERQFLKCKKIDFNKIPKWLLEGNYINTSSTIELLESKINKRSRYHTVDNYYPISMYESSHSIKTTKLIEKLLKKQKDTVNSESEFRDKLRKVLNCFTSDKKLLKEIPEFKKYFPNDPNVCTALIPVELIKEVRKEIKKG